jgi:DNA-binding NtrC family response regulator
MTLPRAGLREGPAPAEEGGSAPRSAARPSRHKPAHVLVVDDEPAARRSLARVLQARGLLVDTAESGAAALDLLRTRPVDVVLLDRDLPEPGGLPLLAELRRRHPEVEVVLLVPLGDPDAAAAAVRAGAYAVVSTPLPAPEAVVPPVERAAERRRLIERVRSLETQLAEHEQLGEIVGSSARMVDLLRRAFAAASSAAPVLILGERGTGKDLLARAVHRRSPRARAPLVVLSLSELRDLTAGAELAAALEQAEGGTLLLEDLGSLPRAAQLTLYQALTGPARPDVRLLTTALPDLREQVARGDFREDLFYRLASVLLEVPPLRRRREDVPLLAYHFLSRAAAREGKAIRRIGPEALRALRRHAWPGNVGELRYAVEHAVVMARGESILPADLPLGRDEEALENADEPGVAFATSDVLELPYAEAKERAVAAFDEAYVERRLKHTSENMSEAARLSGLDRSNFRRLVKRVRGREE